MSKVSPIYTYELSGKKYDFQFKKPTIGDQIKIGHQFAMLKGGYPQLDQASENLAFRVSTLNNVIVNKPTKDFDFMEMDSDDWSVISKMFEDYEKFAFFRQEASQPTQE